MTKSTQENVFKNVIVVLASLALIPPLSRALDSISEAQMGNFLLIISMLLVTVCFANFAFTYEKVHMQSRGSRYLAHVATAIFMLLIALLLEVTVLAVQVVYPSFSQLIFGFVVLLYVGVALYDMWDFQRNEKQ